MSDEGMVIKDWKSETAGKVYVSQNKGCTEISKESINYNRDPNELILNNIDSHHTVPNYELLRQILHISTHSEHQTNCNVINMSVQFDNH